MGWINQGQLREASGRSLQAKDLKQAANDSATAEGLEFGFCEKTAQTSDLPFISPDTVAKNDGSGSGGRLWIVIDGVVYDCTEWLKEHPGGPEVIESFKARDCSWQFWRFHSREQLQEFGLPLRVGRTEGVSNPYQEPTRYMRLRGFDQEDW